MGRYVSGGFDYKFAFGEQGSSFGEVLESFTYSNLNLSVARYTGTEGQGEIIHLDIWDIDQFIEYLECEYLKGFEPITDEEWDKWSKMDYKIGQDRHDKNMMSEFLKELKENKMESMKFYVEY